MMAAKTPGVEIPIQARATGFEAAFARINSLAKTSADGVRNAYSTLGTVAGAVGVGIGLNAIASALTTIGAKTIDGERSLNALNATLRATGNAAGLTVSQLEDLGAELQDSTVFDDDAIRKAETALLRFRSVQGDVFRDAIRLAPDLAAALSTDLPTAAQALGKALSDPEGGMKALKSAGIALSEQQKDLAARFIEAGDKASAQKIVLDELRKSIGGSAAADAAGLYGATQRLARSWDDLQKAMGGKLLSDNSSLIDATTRALERLNNMAKDTRVSLTELATSPGALLRLGADVVRTIAGAEPRNGGRSASGKISGVTPEMMDAEAAAARAREQEAEDQRYIRNQAALKRRVDMVAAANASLLAETRFYIDRESALYEAGYARNEVATSEFFEQQRKAANATTQAVLFGLGKQGEAIEQLMNAPSTSVDERAGLLTRLHGIASDQEKARYDLKKQLLDIDIKQAGAVRALISDYEDLEAQLAAISGDAALASRVGFDAANRDRADRISVELNSSNPEAREAAQAAALRFQELRYATIQQGALTDAMREFQRTLDEVGDAQERINIQVASGALTEIEGLQQTSQIRAARIDQLKQELEVARQVAEAIAAPEARKQALDNIEALKVKLEELAATGDLVAKKFNQIGASATSGFLQDLASGKGFKASFKTLADDLFSNITKVFADDISQTLFKPDGPLGGFGDIFSSLLGGGKAGSGASALTGSATALTTSGTILSTAGASLSAAASALMAAAGLSSASNAADSFTSFLPGITDMVPPEFGIPAFALGTDYVPRTGLALVHQGERITNAAQNRRASGMRSRPNVTQVFNVAPRADTQSIRQAAKAGWRAGSGSARRG
jgi:hypothetical protein